jgi:diguanylate cyclase (GGDEF)-like protein
LKDQYLELAELRRRIALLTEEARKNEETWKRSQRREMALLEAENLKELLAHLTTGLRRAYRLEAASVALADPDHEIRNLLRSQGEEPDKLENVLLVDTVGRLVRRLRARNCPWLGAFTESLHRPLFTGGARLASVALLPLVRQTRVVGSLHFGSSDPDRFTGAHATDFLSHLASIAAFGLENAVNRARLVQRAFTDTLTGWHNRSYLETRLGEEFARSQREQTPLVCLLLDVDHFKRVNDNHGHAAGDAVLREVARRVGAEVRGSDISARYGGEEFIVLLPRTRLETARLLAERVRAAVSAETFGVGVLDRPLTMTVSIGLAEYRPVDKLEDPEKAAKRLVADADRALYEAKAAGRNVVALAAA